MKEDDVKATESPLSHHILPTSGTMIGICMTLIGLVKVTEGHIGPRRVDEYASLVAVIFLVSAIASYLSIRYRRQNWLYRRLEHFADISFLVGLFAIVAIGLLFAYEII